MGHDVKLGQLRKNLRSLSFHHTLKALKGFVGQSTTTGILGGYPSPTGAKMLGLTSDAPSQELPTSIIGNPYRLRKDLRECKKLSLGK